MIESEVDHVENTVPTDGCRQPSVQTVQAETGFMDDLSRYGPRARNLPDSAEEMEKKHANE